MADDARAADEPAPTYASMLAELETILAELEADAVDVDVLATRVARAQEIIAACRARIDGARMDVERLLDP